MKNKKILYTALAVGLAVALAAGGWWFFSQNKRADPKANAMVVLETMMNGPNRELFDPAATIMIGLGVPEQTAEEKAKQKELQEQIHKNWEAAVGKYFAPNCFEGFMNTCAQQYVAMAEMMEQPVVMKEAKLVEEDPYLLKYDVTLSVGTEIQQVEAVLRVDENGLFTFVSVMAVAQ